MAGARKWIKTVNEYRSQIIKPNSECCVCGSKDNLTLDHVIPISILDKMGIDKFSAFAYDKNFAIMCKICNGEKRGRIIRELPETREAIKQIFGL